MIINDTHCNTLLSYLRDHIYRCGGPSAIVMVKVHHDAGTPCRQPVAMDDCISDISAGFDTVTLFSWIVCQNRFGLLTLLFSGSNHY